MNVGASEKEISVATETDDRRARRATWRKHFESRLVTPEQAVAKVESGDRIYITNTHDSPLLAALIGRVGELSGVEVRALGIWKDYGFQNAAIAPMIRGNMSFGTPITKAAIAEGIVDYTVTGFGDIHRDIDQKRAGSAPWDFCWLSVTPPNESGYCCIGAELWDIRYSLSRSKVRVAALNDHLPRTFGSTWVHASEIDYFIEDHKPFPMRQLYSPSEEAKAIAGHVSGLVRDRDTLQIGTGSTSGVMALLGAFDDKEDLGYFAEMSVAGLTDLVDRGVITSKYATVHPNKFVTTGLTGGAEEYAYADGNPFFEFYDYDYMLDPTVIARNDNMVAINNGLSIDLRGQINLISIGPKIHSGSGGQLSYHVGAYLSRGGRAITVLPSTAADGTISRIVPQFPAGQMVTVPWDLADTIVTEYGVADLVGKSIRQRAQALIDIAHPDHRPELRRAVSQLL